MPWWRRFVRGSESERELDEEIRFHLEQEAQLRIDRGESRDAAMTAARRTFGNVTRVKEIAREVSGGRLLAARIGTDLRFALRRPRFALLIVLTLGVGIGATTAAVDVALRILATPLPVADESRLVLINKVLPAGSTYVPFSPAEVAAWSGASRTLEQVGGVQYDGAWPWPAQLGAQAFVVTGTTVSGNFFSVLGAAPMLGRLLSHEDGLVGSEDVAVIGHRLWRTRFGADHDVVGKKLRLNGRLATIVGVAPAGFMFPKGAEVWQPLVQTPDVVNEGWFTLLGRLRANVSVQHASAEASLLIDRLRHVAGAGVPRELRAAVIPLKQGIVGDVTRLIGLFVAAGILLFVVASINSIILLLIRGAARGPEIAVCAALGATRGRLIAQLLTEAAGLALAAGICGTVVVFAVQRVLIAMASPTVPRLDQIGFDSHTLLLAAAVSLLAVAITGVAPALWTVRISMFSHLRTPRLADTNVTPGQIGRQVLLGFELAFALLVAIAAALLLRSVQELQNTDLRFQPDRVTVMQVPLAGDVYDDPERRRRVFEELVSRLEEMPVIEAASPALIGPFTGTAGWNATFTGEGQGSDEIARNPPLNLEAVAPHYFSTLRMTILQGRAFSESDRTEGEPVAIVSESLARHAFPAGSALGKRLKFGGRRSGTPWMTVVGIVPDVRYRDIQAPPPTIYVPLPQAPFPPRFLLVRSSAAPASVMALTQQILKGIDADEMVVEGASLEDLLRRELRGPRAYTFALTMFAATAVLLAGVGVFAVLGAFVARRTREIGLRIALGATTRDVRRVVLTRLTWPALFGVTVGTGAAVAVAPFLDPMLFQVDAVDPRAFAAGAVVLLAATLAAAVVPLRRAGHVDPVVLLRAE